MVTSFLLENWARFFGSPCPEGVQVAVMTSCLYEYGNDLVLIFADADSTPSYVMKISRGAEFGFKLEREFAALREIAEDELLRQFVPSAHYLGGFEGRTFFIEEGIRGTSLARLIREQGLTRTNRMLVEKALDLLVDLNSYTTGGEPAGEIGDTTRLDLTATEDNLVADRVAELSPAASRYYLHGDYWPANLLIRDGDISGIVDWEFAAPVSPLPADIIWFLINLGYVMAGAVSPEISVEESYRWAFFQAGECTEFLNDLRRRYFGAMGIDDLLFLPLLEVSLSEMAQRELQAYGQHGKMDQACLEMLRHTLSHEKNLCVG